MPTAAKETGATDNHRGDSLQLHTDTGIGKPGIGAAGHDQPSHSGHQSTQSVNRNEHPVDVNSALPRGLRIAADRFGVALAEIDHFYLAGGFGRHIDPEAAQRIGLIPQLADEKIVQVGNAALAGTVLGNFGSLDDILGINEKPEVQEVQK